MSKDRFVRLFHCTTQEAALAIARDGFRDPDPAHPRTKFAGRVGVWLADAPTTSTMNFAQGDELIIVDLDLSEQELAKYDEGEPDPEPGSGEWCLPADLVNSRGRIRYVTDQGEADSIREQYWRLPPGYLRAKRQRGVSVDEYSRELLSQGKGARS